MIESTDGSRLFRCLLQRARTSAGSITSYSKVAPWALQTFRVRELYCIVDGYCYVAPCILPPVDLRTQQSELWGQKRLVAKLKSALMAKDGSDLQSRVFAV